MRALIAILILTCFSVACTTAPHSHVPVYEISTGEPVPKSGAHRVAADETLYSIAWRYGFDYRVLAARNHIRPPYSIKIGQIIYLTPRKIHPTHSVQPTIALKKPPKKRARLTRKTAEAADVPVFDRLHAWQWPARGTVSANFSAFNKGINIVGHRGDPIFATKGGKVVYSGNGLRGYGYLIIIKHNSTFLTAYAHNSKLLVKEGQWVKTGQEIAKMGNTGTQTVMLHFEIRRNGKPVNPLIYLGRKI